MSPLGSSEVRGLCLSYGLSCLVGTVNAYKEAVGAAILWQQLGRAVCVSVSQFTQCPCLCGSVVSKQPDEVI